MIPIRAAKRARDVRFTARFVILRETPFTIATRSADPASPARRRGHPARMPPSPSAPARPPGRPHHARPGGLLRDAAPAVRRRVRSGARRRVRPGVRARRGLPARAASPRTRDRRGHGSPEIRADGAVRDSSTPTGSRPARSRRDPRHLGHRRPADGARGGGRPRRRREREASSRCATAARRGGGPHGPRRRTDPDQVAPRRRARRLGPRHPVRPLRDRPRVPGGEGGDRGRRVGVARGRGPVRTDRRKQNTLVVAAGWTVPRFTWHDLQKRPTQVVAEIRAALTRAR
ncbi:MAG: hypothetical protein JWP64_925 [Pseudonocardia sp.]|nr:hypothetical protein [Pseudonocardia sp.]